jgi:heptosyltransferase-2
VTLLEEGWGGTRRSAARVRRAYCDAAVVLPGSFRAALVPWLAGVPRRVGQPGHARRPLLTRVLPPPPRRHQSLEPYPLLGLETPARPPDGPRLAAPAAAVSRADERLSGLPRPLVGLAPGAARGPSKRWPPEHFAELGRRLCATHGCGLVVTGGRGDAAAARLVLDAAPTALDLTGRTGLEEWAAVLQACDAVVANDSGAMHLAAAVGTPVTAIYGVTDPERTGPLGVARRIVRSAGSSDRDVPRDSPEARRRLAAIAPARVEEAVLDLLRNSGTTGQGAEGCAKRFPPA